MEILHNLHVVPANEADNPDDKLWKVRPMIKRLQESFKEYWQPSNELTVDEEIVPRLQLWVCRLWRWIKLPKVSENEFAGGRACGLFYGTGGGGHNWREFVSWGSGGNF